IDAEADTILDSVIFQGTHVQVAASPDGKYLGVWGADPCSRIYNTTDFSILAELDCRPGIAFVPEAGIIVGSGRDTTKFYDYNTFDLLADDTFAMYNMEPIRSTTTLTGLIMYSESGGFDSSGFVIYDCKAKEIINLWHRFHRPDGGIYRYLYYADVSPSVHVYMPRQVRLMQMVHLGGSGYSVMISKMTTQFLKLRFLLHSTECKSAQ
ncbi:MAG: hypothetical protein GY869_02025, partial [Planctomycetes bacterium]|nr:hypothetical protein [Planctomycetota bacterium]